MSGREKEGRREGEGKKEHGAGADYSCQIYRNTNPRIRISIKTKDGHTATFLFAGSFSDIIFITGLTLCTRDK